MLNRLKPMLSGHVYASDGFIGKLDDVYFDDAQWIVRYLVVDTGHLLRRHKVLIAPEAIAGTDWPRKILYLTPSMEQIRNSPDIDADKPVYRQIEEQLINYYGWVTHWVPQHDLPEPEVGTAPTGDTHLRSLNNVCKYVLRAFDGRVGMIEDLVVEDIGWRIPAALFDTHHYLPVAQVVIPTARIKGINCDDKEISLDARKSDIESAPVFDETRPLEQYLRHAA